jgi:hypothetical protein
MFFVGAALQPRFCRRSPGCFGEVGLSIYADLNQNSLSELSGFNTKSYCKQVATSIGGSYQIEQTCLQFEAKARSSVEGMTIPPRIKEYCLSVARLVGGSYQIYETYAQKELEAKSRLD